MRERSGRGKSRFKDPGLACRREGAARQYYSRLPLHTTDVGRLVPARLGKRRGARYIDIRMRAQ